MIRFIRIALVALAASPLAARAQAAPASGQPALTIAVRNQTAADEAARGALRATSGVRPGDVLHYTLRFSNATTQAVRVVQLSNPLPKELEYLAASAQASRTDARLEFSIDGGKTFAGQPMETVLVDGRRARRPASASRYTNIRWIVTGEVPAGTTVVAEYDARVGRAAAPAATRPASSAAPSSSGPRRGTR